MKLKNWIILGLLLLTLSMLTACSGPDEHLWLKTPDWSRAAFLGNTTVNDPIPMAVDDEGQLYFVAQPGYPCAGG